jgi:AcrR family transcriptional regulator
VSILKAAEALFCATGFEGTSVASIAARANVTKAAVFYHFDNKERLFEAVLDGYYERQRAVFDKAVEGEADPRERMHRVVDVYHRSLIENRGYLMLVMSVLASDSPHAENIKKSTTPMVEWLEEELKSVVPTSGHRSVLHCYASVTGAIHHYFSHARVLQRDGHPSLMSEEALEERAEHLHWLVDAIFERLAAGE